MRTQKEDRLHIRVTVHQKNIIAKAAEMQGVTMTNFMLEAAYRAASELILDQTERRVPVDKWSIIESALSAPAEKIGTLAEMAQKYGHLLEEPLLQQNTTEDFASLSSDSNDKQVASVASKARETDYSSAASVTYEKKSAIAA